MRIGIIVPEFPTYSETFFVSLVKGLCEKGHNVMVFRSIINNDQSLAESYGLQNCRNLQIINVSFSPSIIEKLRKILNHPRSVMQGMVSHNMPLRRGIFEKIRKSYFDQHVCDVYHFGYSGLAISYFNMLNSLKGKIMISCLGSAEKVKPLSEEGRISKLKYVLNMADSIHCVSKNMRDTVITYGAPENKIYINRPAIDHIFFQRENAYTSKPFIHILSIGRLFFQKGFPIGLLAMGILKEKFHGFKWTIVGEGPDMEELCFQVNAMGLNDHVLIAGRKNRREVYELYETSDIFFLPSVSEGIANVVLEAMSMQLPVVSSDCGGMAEAITHGENGLLCRNYDYHNMAESIYSLCIDFGKRKRLGERARETIEQSFTLQRYIDVYEREYAKIIKD
jgi:colanic acid/amylovoran biosynthesis glycosyltransferase